MGLVSKSVAAKAERRRARRASKLERLRERRRTGDAASPSSDGPSSDSDSDTDAAAELREADQALVATTTTTGDTPDVPKRRAREVASDDEDNDDDDTAAVAPAEGSDVPLEPVSDGAVATPLAELATAADAVKDVVDERDAPAPDSPAAGSSHAGDSSTGGTPSKPDAAKKPRPKVPPRGCAHFVAPLTVVAQSKKALQAEREEQRKETLRLVRGTWYSLSRHSRACR
jgi:hypothetical protein